MWLQWQHPPKCLASHMSAQPLTGKCCRRECPARPPKVPRRQLRHPLGRENPGGGAFQNRGGFGPPPNPSKGWHKKLPVRQPVKGETLLKKFKFSFGGNSRNGDSMQYFLVHTWEITKRQQESTSLKKNIPHFYCNIFQLDFLEYL